MVQSNENYAGQLRDLSPQTRLITATRLSRELAGKVVAVDNKIITIEQAIADIYSFGVLEGMNLQFSQNGRNPVVIDWMANNPDISPLGHTQTLIARLEERDPRLNGLVEGVGGQAHYIQQSVNEKFKRREALIQQQIQEGAQRPAQTAEAILEEKQALTYQFIQEEVQRPISTLETDLEMD